MNGNGNGNGGGQSTGVISKSLDWIFHAQYSDTRLVDWFAFTLLALGLGYLWSKVVRQVLEAV
jgi:hypothetical protein